MFQGPHDRCANGNQASANRPGTPAPAKRNRTSRDLNSPIHYIDEAQPSTLGSS